MADFKPFSLSQATLAGQQMAGNFAKIQGVVGERQKSTKAAGLRQRVSEGDSDALGELMSLDPKSAKQMMDMLNTMEDRDRETMKQQNNATAKAIMWTMEAPSEQERSQRWDQSIDHLVNNQGFKEVEKYKGKYSQGSAQMMLMQAMTMDQLLDQKQGSFGQSKPGLDAQGKPVFFTTDKSGKSTIIEGVKPSEKQLFGKGGKKDGRPIKAGDSNAISKRAAEYYNVPFTKNADGSISYEFPTSNEAQKASNVKGLAEKIFRENPKLGHNEAFLRAVKEIEDGTSEKTPSLKDAGKHNNKTSLLEFLKVQR